MNSGQIDKMMTSDDGVSEIVNHLTGYWLRGGENRYGGVDLVEWLQNTTTRNFWTVLRTAMELDLSESEHADLIAGTVDRLIENHDGDLAGAITADADRPAVAEYLASTAEDCMAAVDPWHALLASDLIVSLAGIDPTTRRERAALRVEKIDPISGAAERLAMLRTAALGGGPLLSAYLKVELANTPDQVEVPVDWYTRTAGQRDVASEISAEGTANDLTRFLRYGGPTASSKVARACARNPRLRDLVALGVEATLRRNRMLEYDPNTAQAIVGAIRRTGPGRASRSR